MLTCVRASQPSSRVFKRTTCLQQKQFQQISCRLCLQSVKPEALGVSPNSGVSIRTDHCHREDKYPIEISSPTVGQKECGQKAGAGSS
ncbi:uncharacterized protein isoform X2 [Salmo salar]|uniref:Uncharacterized protein isoform X2 n=1 Tax=Salmo salar TaxID=8030 RepID=A0ABM3CTK1_SALSA|nr:uncharacterized protein LOC106568965 isoform X2 [Salmo salar]